MHLQRPVEGGQRIVVRVEAVVELAGDEDLAAVDAGVADGLGRPPSRCRTSGPCRCAGSPPRGRSAWPRGSASGGIWKTPKPSCGICDAVVQGDHRDISHGPQPGLPAWRPASAPPARRRTVGRGDNGRQRPERPSGRSHVSLRHRTAHHRRPGHDAGRPTPGRRCCWSTSPRKCGLHPAVHRPGAAAEGVRRPRFQRAGLPVQPVHGGRSRAPTRRSRSSAATTYGVTFPAVRQDRGQRAGPASALRRADRGPRTPRARPAMSSGTSRSSWSRRTGTSSPASAPRPCPTTRRSSRPSRPSCRRRTVGVDGAVWGWRRSHRGFGGCVPNGAPWPTSHPGNTCPRRPARR